MQNWMTKRMKHEEVKSNIKACDKFLCVYEKGKYFERFSCLFCDIARKFHPKCRDRCNYCVWMVLEGEGCEDFSQIKFVKQIADIKHDKRWREARIPTLKRWKKILMAELKRRNK